MTGKAWNAPFHPAEHLREDFLKPLGMSDQQAADALHLSLKDVEPFFLEKAPLTGDLALRLERAFGCTAEYWMTWQSKYELQRAGDALGDELDTIRRVVPVAAE